MHRTIAFLGLVLAANAAIAEEPPCDSEHPDYPDCLPCDEEHPDWPDCDDGPIRGEGCEDCEIDFEELKTRLDDAMDEVGLPLDRIYPDIPDFGITFEFPIVNLRTGVTIDTAIFDFDPEFSNVGAVGPYLNGFRQAIRGLLGLAVAVLLVFKSLRTLNYGGG